MLRTHWGVDDPAHAPAPTPRSTPPSLTAYRILRTRIEAFLALPLDATRSDRRALKAELDRIGKLDR